MKTISLRKTIIENLFISPLNQHHQNLCKKDTTVMTRKQRKRHIDRLMLNCKLAIILYRLTR